jgi:hypothetical protein
VAQLVEPALALCPPPVTLRPMTPETELAHLRQEVATLRQHLNDVSKQMNDLLRFITIETEEGSDEPRNMNLRCAEVAIHNPYARHQTQMYVCGGVDGPLISLWDSRQKGRVILSVENDVPAITLCTAQHREAVRLEVDPKNGRGLVTVFDKGKPRALMKAGEDGTGSISVVHDDGHARVTMHGTENSGCLMTINPDMKTTVKISSEGRTGGGLVVVNGPTGQPAAFLTHDLAGGVVVVNGPDGQPLRACRMRASTGGSARTKRRFVAFRPQTRFLALVFAETWGFSSMHRL